MVHGVQCVIKKLRKRVKWRTAEKLSGLKKQSTADEQYLSVKSLKNRK